VKIVCLAGERVKDNACISCPPGTTNADGGDDASGSDTSATIPYAALNEYVSGNACEACPAGTTNADGETRFGRRHGVRQDPMRG
jgi:hypothetical protein